MKNILQITLSIFTFLLTSVFLPLSSFYAFENEALKELQANFLNPPMDCRPHTYWWWPGNAVTKEEITWELEQMHDKGIGGVLINSAAPEMYEKGNIPFLSDKYLEMVKHAVRVAKKLGMEVNLNFSTGWVFGGYWVPPKDRSQSLVPASVDLQGPTIYNSELPKFTKASDRRGEISIENIPDIDKLIAVIAGRVVDNRIDQSSLVELTNKVNGETLTWRVPEGHWRLMVFWLKYTGQKSNYEENGLGEHWCVDHFSKEAMQRYCDFLGGKFYQAFGKEFGKTVEALHSDSFELANLPNGIYWSDSLMAEFRKMKGYDLAKYLPAIWWEVDNISAKIRYDVNEFLHHVGLETYFNTFLQWCEVHGVKGSMEPYGFTTDILQGAGLAHLPFNEVTPGEKDAVPWFDTRIGPKKYVTSGAHLYGRNVVGVEAYTYIHWELYRATLEELKIASDGFLRSGANKFYNHGYSYSPERDVTPSRSIPFAARITHTNVWWKYYPLLAKYIARCSYLLRQDDFAADIAIYSPLANQWTLNVLNARKWTREFYWGELGKLLIANGYDFDLVNDDVLQKARIEDGKIRIRNLEYKILILPNIKALPLETMVFTQQYVQKGGVVIALERVPDSSVGFVDYANKDEKVREIVNEMFTEPRGDNGTGPQDYGQGRTYHIKLVINRQDVLDWRSSALDPFVNTLRKHCTPDFGIDFAVEGLRENNGLTFLHRKLKDADIYFVTNIQDRPSTIPVTFRVKAKCPWKWNPYNGKISKVFQFCENENGTQIPIRLAPYESTFFVFINPQGSHVEQSNLFKITNVTQDAVEALATENGMFTLTTNNKINRSVSITDVPAPYAVTGNWRLTLEGRDFPRMDTTLTHFYSWTKNPRSKHFSGTGRYEISFDLPNEYIAKDNLLQIDLGKVGNVADVELNGTNVGTVWMRGQTLDITEAAQAGTNRLVVWVTNTLINRVSGFKQPPPVPETLVPHYGSGTTPYSTRFHGPIGFEPLPASGLMGPIKIRVLKKVRIVID